MGCCFSFFLLEQFISVSFQIFKRVSARAYECACVRKREKFWIPMNEFDVLENLSCWYIDYLFNPTENRFKRQFDILRKISTRRIMGVAMVISARFGGSKSSCICKILLLIGKIQSKRIVVILRIDLILNNKMLIDLYVHLISFWHFDYLSSFSEFPCYTSDDDDDNNKKKKKNKDISCWCFSSFECLIWSIIQYWKTNLCRTIDWLIWVTSLTMFFFASQSVNIFPWKIVSFPLDSIG